MADEITTEGGTEITTEDDVTITTEGSTTTHSRSVKGSMGGGHA